MYMPGCEMQRRISSVVEEIDEGNCSLFFTQMFDPVLVVCAFA